MKISAIRVGPGLTSAGEYESTLSRSILHAACAASKRDGDTSRACAISNKGSQRERNIGRHYWRLVPSRAALSTLLRAEYSALRFPHELAATTFTVMPRRFSSSLREKIKRQRIHFREASGAKKIGLYA